MPEFQKKLAPWRVSYLLPTSQNISYLKSKHLLKSSTSKHLPPPIKTSPTISYLLQVKTSHNKTSPTSNQNISYFKSSPTQYHLLQNKTSQYMDKVIQPYQKTLTKQDKSNHLLSNIISHKKDKDRR